jgi:hypothetical protein
MDVRVRGVVPFVGGTFVFLHFWNDIRIHICIIIHMWNKMQVKTHVY